MMVEARRLAASDPEAGHDLDELLARARRLAGRVARVGVDAEDLAQSAVLEVLRCQHNHRNAGPFMAWAHRVMSRLMWRRAARDVGESGPSAAAMIDPRTGPSSAAMRGELRARLGEFVERLPEAQRETLRLRVLEGCSIEEIAERTATPIETTRTRLRVAKQRLATWIAGDPVLRGVIGAP